MFWYNGVSNISHNCTQLILDYMPNVEVAYVVDYSAHQKNG